MVSSASALTVSLISILMAAAAQARVWTDDTGHYTLEAELVAASDDTVVLKLADDELADGELGDHELVAIPMERLSAADREYLASKEALELAKKLADEPQSWALRDGTEVTGRVVDYAKRDVTIQRRRGRVYVNDRTLDNLPEFYRELIPKIVAHFEKLPRADRRTFQDWVTRQRGESTTYNLEGVILEMENGDEYGVPFFLFSDEDLKWLKGGWDEWLAAHDEGDEGYEAQEDLAFLLQSLSAARERDHLVQREIAMMQLKLQAVQAGITALWEVVLFPAADQLGPPLWVVVPGRDSRQATQNALLENPGYVAGPVRRVSRR